MTPPPAVAPAAPVSAPQAAAPPGGSPPSGSAQHGGLFGEILDSARTAVAEGHKETGKNAGDHSSDAKSSSSNSKESSASETPSGADVIAAAMAFLSGQTPPAAEKTSSDSKSADAASAVDSAHSSASSTTDAVSPATSQSGDAAKSTDMTASDLAQSTSTQDASAQAGASAKDDHAASVAEKSSEPKSGSDATSDLKPVGAEAVTPVATGAYKPQPATEAAKVATEAKAAVDATSQTDATSQADVQGQAVAPQSSAPPRDEVAAAKPAIDGKQSRAAVVTDQAKPATAAAQSQAQSSSSTVTSPTSARQPQTGADSHGGMGSEGHGSAGTQQAATPAAATAPSTSDDSSSTSVFSVPGASTASAAHTAVKLPDGVVRSAVTMQEAVDAVKATFTAANQAGISSARISLSPESLGGIKISLSQTPDGLIARVAADHPEAALTLQQNAGDLKRSLEASGMSLLRLDIGSSGQQSLGGFAGSEQDGSSAGGNWAGGDAGSIEEDTTSTPSELAVELSNGSLVNVLA